MRISDWSSDVCSSDLQDLFEALAVLAVHRLEDFVDDRVRQVLDQVGQVVDVEVFDRGDDLVRVHVREQAFAHLVADVDQYPRSEEHTSELQSLMRISYAVFCLKIQKK